MDNKYFVDSDKLSEAALKKSTSLKIIRNHAQIIWNI